MTIDDEWEKFLDQGKDACDFTSLDESYVQLQEHVSPATFHLAPIATPIYISTKTKIAYLNSRINLEEVFWKIKLVDYSSYNVGVLKKQIKLCSNSKTELEALQEKLQSLENVDQYIIHHSEIENNLKDVRKISIGISRRDLVKNRCKKKGAFYNCVVLILRVCSHELFHEYHVKLFNTGKIEIPGIQTDDVFTFLLSKLIDILQPFHESILRYIDNTEETVLINSNFHCGFLINRNELYRILKYKYHIHAIYDPCSYPGVQCKFYFDSQSFEPVNHESVEIQCMRKKKPINLNIIEVSFMIFRTGSVLIVGKCEDHIIHKVYQIIASLLSTEYSVICQDHQHVSCVKVSKQTLKKKLFINSRATH
jgi:hypothetical protein